jgi:hypothetical protein
MVTIQIAIEDEANSCFSATQRSLSIAPNRTGVRRIHPVPDAVVTTSSEARSDDLWAIGLRFLSGVTNARTSARTSLSPSKVKTIRFHDGVGIFPTSIAIPNG